MMNSWFQQWLDDDLDPIEGDNTDELDELRQQIAALKAENEKLTDVVGEIWHATFDYTIQSNLAIAEIGYRFARICIGHLQAGVLSLPAPRR